MAESKRLSMAGRVAVATPRVASMTTPTVPLDMALTRCIGAKVRVQLSAPPGRTIEGTLAAISTTAHLLTISAPPPPPTATASSSDGPPPSSSASASYTVLPIPALQSFQLLELPPGSGPGGGGGGAVVPAPVDTLQVRKRVDKAVATALEREASRGKGVSREAQDLFDALRKTLPVRWDGASIVVSDSVLVPPPYRGTDARLLEGVSSQGLAHVRKAVDSVRQRLADKGGGGTQAVVPTTGSGQRKGG